MNNRNSCSVNLRKTEHSPEKTCKAFQDISKYFSKEEWAKLSYSEKITYVYMKRNYTTMTSLGLKAHLPDFMEPKEEATKSVLSDSDEGCGHESQEHNERKLSIWSHRLRERKKPVIYEEISDPEEEDEDEKEEGWTYRRNKPMI
ncbi:protein SSXA1-like [Mesocricetus auratus]|uniref:Protein SSXA1-like n=1 Tax=Mesocricetus auratus TaxID=10036 RepID=A0A3Q0C8U0_MESAU|nr:protein SSXA1-like [Mesocricetus auratus]